MTISYEDSLKSHGIYNPGHIYWNLTTPALYEEAVRRGEGYMAHCGPLVVHTGQYTGRSPKDKFIVDEPANHGQVAWGDVNRPMSEDQFRFLNQRVIAYLQDRDLFVQNCFAGAETAYRLPIRVITEKAWHSLFARNMFIRPKSEELATHRPEFTIIHAPNCQAVPDIDGTNSEAFVVIHFEKCLILIGGTQYAGEIKKSIFTIMNYLLPQQDVLSMHCSSNRGTDDTVALFFGLSGTGKTTLSTDPARTLIGDDEHGWSERGIFNIEGGCYAKTIRLSPIAEPHIFDTTRRFGTVLENVILDDQSRQVDLDDEALTENTRAAYPITHIPNVTVSGLGGHPDNIIMLTADAFGVLPPISKLTPDQAVYHFLSGYTAKVAGTERGIVEPEATFSACFGEPFMVHHPTVYAKLLRQKLIEHGTQIWLINTGWSGGAYGEGTRINLRYTRDMVHAALHGSLINVETRVDPIFNLVVPLRCPSVPDALLDPRLTWQDEGQYETQARHLAQMFIKNFAKFAEAVSAEILAAGPKVEG